MSAVVFVSVITATTTTTTAPGVVAARRVNRGNNACCSGRKTTGRGDVARGVGAGARHIVRAGLIAGDASSRTLSQRAAWGEQAQHRRRRRGERVGMIPAQARAGGGAGHNGGKDFYRLLEITPAADAKQIKSAFRKAALKYHPDVNKAPDANERFDEIKKAYQTLSDPEQRRQYDTHMGGGWAQPGSYGGMGSSRAARPRPRASTRSRTKPEEEFYGFTQFLEDIEKEFDSARKERGNEPRTLWDELNALGEEFVEFLEEVVPQNENTSTSTTSTSTDRNGNNNTTTTTTNNTSSTSSTSSGSYRSSSSSSSSSSASSGTRSSTYRSSTTTTSSTSSSSSYSSSSASTARRGGGGTPPPPKRESVDDMLEKMKRDMGLK